MSRPGELPQVATFSAFTFHLKKLLACRRHFLQTLLAQA
jgi:hypothetical protein